MISHPRIAVAVAVLGLAAVCRAQGPAVPAAAPQTGNATTSDVQYDTYFEPFDDDPVQRLQDIAPLPTPTPLFDAYDPAIGLAQNVQTSRVVRTNRAIFAFPVMTVKVGQEFDLPCFYQSSTRISGVTFRTAYDIDKLVPTTARPGQWQRSAVVFNAKPEDTNSTNTFAIVQYSADSFGGPGSLFTVHFKAIAPGESPIQVHAFDASDDVTFDHVRSLVRDGLVIVQP